MCTPERYTLWYTLVVYPAWYTLVVYPAWYTLGYMHPVRYTLWYMYPVRYTLVGIPGRYTLVGIPGRYTLVGTPWYILPGIHHPPRYTPVYTRHLPGSVPTSAVRAVVGGRVPGL